MQEALTLFDSICNSRWFVKTSIVRPPLPSPPKPPLTPPPAPPPPDPLPKQNRPLLRKTPPLPTRRLLLRLHRRRQLRGSMRLPPPPLRLPQPERSDQADIRTLYVRDGYAADQMCVPPLFPFFIIWGLIFLLIFFFSRVERHSGYTTSTAPARMRFAVAPSHPHRVCTLFIPGNFLPPRYNNISSPALVPIFHIILPSPPIPHVFFLHSYYLLHARCPICVRLTVPRTYHTLFTLAITV